MGPEMDLRAASGGRTHWSWVPAAPSSADFTRKESREFVWRGYADVQLYIDGIRDSLQTESAKNLVNALEESDPNEWWKRVCGLL